MRSLSPPGAGDSQIGVIFRLDRLDADGTIGRYDVVVWGRGYPPSTSPRTGPGRSIHERLVKLDEWAARTGLSVAPFFQRRTGRLEQDGTTEPSLVTPKLVLAEYLEGSLHHVSPCTDGESTYSIGDHLDSVANGEPRVRTDPDSRPRRVPALVPDLQEVQTRTHETELQVR